MARVRVARMVVVSVELHCPYCGAELAAPGGALVWEVAEIETGKQISCPACGETTELPKTRFMEKRQGMYSR